MVESNSRYINPGSQEFRKLRESNAFVDKSMFIDQLNPLIGKYEENYVCLSYPNRFGKTSMLDMLTAYYSRKADSSALFDGLKISRCSSYKEHLSKYNVIRINMQEFFGTDCNPKNGLDGVEEVLTREIVREFPDIKFTWSCSLWDCLLDLAVKAGPPLILLIDEWDAIFLDFPDDKESHKLYLEDLEYLLKYKFTRFVYMTGILPVNRSSYFPSLALFQNLTVIHPFHTAPFFGFTAEEVRGLCTRFCMDYKKMEKWYGGYKLNNDCLYSEELQIFSPESVIKAIENKCYGSYRTDRGTYEKLRRYLSLSKEGLQDDIKHILRGESIYMGVFSFGNHITDFIDKDEILTLLIHLGYLSYSRKGIGYGTVRIPNQELAEAFEEIRMPDIIREYRKEKREGSSDRK